MNNRSFLDKCRIYRVTEATSFADGTETELYKGYCDVQIPMTIRTFKVNEVVKTDHAVYIKKKLMELHSGDLIDIELQTGSYTKGLSISEIYSRDMGTMLVLNEPKN